MKNEKGEMKKVYWACFFFSWLPLGLWLFNFTAMFGNTSSFGVPLVRRGGCSVFRFNIWKLDIPCSILDILLAGKFNNQ